MDFLSSPMSKPLYDKLVDVVKEDRKMHEDNSPKKKEDLGCFSILVTTKGFYVGEVIRDLGSSANMISLSLFNKIGGMKLKPCEVRI
jgi:hypothetical protein